MDKEYDETNEVESTQAEETQEDEVTSDNEHNNASAEPESVQEDEESTQEEEEVDWKARALKAERAIEKAKKKGKATETGVDPEKLARLELKAEGIKEAEDQNYILKVAKLEELDIEDALQLDYVQDRLKANERKRMSSQATPRSNNRTNTSVDEVQSWVKKYKQNGSLPENNPALTAKILRALSN